MTLRTDTPGLATGLLVLIAAVMAGCSSPLSASVPVSSPSLSPPVAAPGASGSCHARVAGPYVLPDASCTPGATNATVTQATIGNTICRRGWTSTVRPSESYTEQLKREQMLAYGWPGALSRYEEDHLVPLELGGAPSDPRNLWPEPGASPNPKDSVENAAKRAVCDGRLQLAAAQRSIAGDWVAFGHELGVLA